MSTKIKNIKKGTATKGSKPSIIPESTNSPAAQFEGIPGCEQDESEVRKLNQELISLRRKSAEVTAELGRILHNLKEKTPHGQWESYVEGCLGIPRRTASDYMGIWKRIHNLGGWEELFKTANLADLNVSELKAELSELEKSEESHIGTEKNGDSRGSEKDTEVPQKPSAPPFRLSDGSKLSSESVDWRDGLLSRERLQAWLEKSPAPCGNPEENRKQVQLQRVVVQMAATANRACGRANPDVAVNLLERAFSAIAQLLANTESQEKTEIEEVAL